MRLEEDGERSPLPPNDLEAIGDALEQAELEELLTVLEDELDSSLRLVRPWRVHRVAEQYDGASVGERPDWVDAVLYREVPGIEGQWTDLDAISSFKATYVDGEREQLLQLPKRGEHFEERYERVRTTRNGSMRRVSPPRRTTMSWSRRWGVSGTRWRSRRTATTWSRRTRWMMRCWNV
ncbi:MAG: hypothetical protein SVU32_03325 [Candidatus Nanohaloarchaea archaeon]|nr:hypothetical protein [Candidatus Nanohaloarchaea archaeon]